MRISGILLGLSLSAVCPLGGAESSPAKLRVFLVGGQSNAVGQDSATKLTNKLQRPQERIPFYYRVARRKGEPAPLPVYTSLRPGASPKAEGVGPEISFGKQLEAYYRGLSERDAVAVIKYARGGTNLYSQWKAGGDATMEGDGSVYREFQKVVNQGMEALEADPRFKDHSINIEGMLWVQGEADLSHGHASDYADNLKAFIGDVRATYGSGLPFVFTRISDNQTLFSKSEETEVLANYETLREGQAEVAEEIESAVMVAIDAPEFSMLRQSHYKSFFLHFDAKGTIAIGDAAAKAFVESVGSKE